MGLVSTSSTLGAVTTVTGGSDGPNDYVEPMRDRLQMESNNLMLVGHLPYLSPLVAMLLGVRKGCVMWNSAWAAWCDSIAAKGKLGLVWH